MGTDAFVGLDLGGTFLKYALGAKDGMVLAKNKRPSRAKEGQRAVFDTMITAVEELLGEAERLQVTVRAIGCGSPGSVDFDHGKILGNTPNIAGWDNADIRGELQGHFKMPVWADNDANLMTLAECRYGAARGFRSVVAMTLGTGIGGGIVIDNELYRGAHFCGAELGHMTIAYDGIPCNCGSIGCIEAYASAPAMVRNYIEKLTKSKLNVPRSVDTELIFSQARQGQTEANAVIDEVCRYLGAAIGNVINIFNPGLIVIGGGVADAGEDFITQIWNESKRYSMAPSRQGVRLVRAQLGNDAGMVGAFALAADCYDRN